MTLKLLLILNVLNSNLDRYKSAKFFVKHYKISFICTYIRMFSKYPYCFHRLLIIRYNTIFSYRERYRYAKMIIMKCHSATHIKHSTCDYQFKYTLPCFFPLYTYKMNILLHSVMYQIERRRISLINARWNFSLFM